MRLSKFKIITIASFIGISACSNNDNEKPSVDEQLSIIINEQNLTGDPSTNRALPSITDAKAQLGMELFFSKSLGGDQDTACVTCHHPALGGGDKLSLSIGVGSDSHAVLGSGRTHASGDKSPTVPRNAPTTFNIALWDRVLFHDGRVESLGKMPGKNGDDGTGIRTPDSPFGVADVNAGTNLTAAQARFPVTSAPEMRGTTYAVGSNDVLRSRLTQRLQNIGDSVGEINADPDSDSLNNWVNAFEEVYAETSPPENIITFNRVADAIAAYENSQVFVNTPWKDYVAGNKTALSSDAKNGAALFYTSVSQGGAGCVACHAGDFFTDEGFHNIAMPQIGEGKGDGPNGTDDFGRMKETTLPVDKYAFRTPSLLNVEFTGPYGHSGAYDSLRDVIRHHLTPSSSIAEYFGSSGQCESLLQLNNGDTCEDISDGDAETNTVLALSLLDSQQTSGTSKLVNANLSEQQIDQLESFLEALSDPCLESVSCLAQWIPQNSVNIDNNRLEGISEFSSPLIAN